MILQFPSAPTDTKRKGAAISIQKFNRNHKSTAHTSPKAFITLKLIKTNKIFILIQINSKRKFL